MTETLPNKCPQCDVELERVLDETNSGAYEGGWMVEIYYYRCPQCLSTHWAYQVGGEATEICAKCGNKGWYPEPHGDADYYGVQDIRERYCGCSRGERLKAEEGLRDG